MNPRPNSNRHRHTANLFQLQSEFWQALATIALVSLVAVTAAKSQSSAAKPFEAAREAPAKHPGSGEAAIVHVSAATPTVQVGGRTMPLQEALANGFTAPRIVIRFQGAEWENLADFVRTNDLSISIEAAH